jgi:hypothetical protein
MVEFFSYRRGAESAEGVGYVYDYVYESWGWKKEMNREREQKLKG